MARWTREAKFEEVQQRHYIRIYQAKFFVMLYKIYPPLTYEKHKVKKRKAFTNETAKDD